VKNEKVEFTENGFYFSAFGMQGQQPMHFVLNLTLHGAIIPEQSTWNLESVGKLQRIWLQNNEFFKGRLFVNITKAEPQVWVFLLKNNERSPGMRLWWEMKENYKDAMKEYEKLVEKYEEEEAEVREVFRGVVETLNRIRERERRRSKKKLLLLM